MPASGPARNPSHIMMDLRNRNFILTSRRQLNVLVDISQPKYNALMRMLAELGSHHAPFVELRLPKAKLLERVAFETVPPKYFDEFIRGQVLDLRQLETVVKTARSRIESDQIWADEESTPEPKLLEEIRRGRLQITEVAPAELPREVPAPADREQAFFELVQRKSPLLKFGQTITVASILNPASGLTKNEQNLMIEALNFTGRSREDMYDHLIPVAEVVVTFYRRKAIAFGVGNEINFQNNGTAERLEYLVATMVRKGFYGRGLQTVVNGIYSIQRKGTPMAMMRSRSAGTIDGFEKHFSGVSYRLDTPDKRRRAREFSRFMGCECDENGIVRDAYETPPHDPERDQEILKALEKRSPRRYNWMATSLEGLGPRDARIYQGRLTRWKKFLFRFYINVIFRLRNRRLERQENAGQDQT